MSRKVPQGGSGGAGAADEVPAATGPTPGTSRGQARERLSKLLAEVKWAGPGPEPSEDEVMEMVVEEIKAMRREDREKGRS